MRVAVDCGLERLVFEVAGENLIASRPPPAALPGPSAAVRAALESPHGYPPLRRALTPGDRVTVVVDEQLPQLARLLVRAHEELVQQAELVHHLQGRGVDGVAAEVPEEVAVLFEDDDLNSRPGEQQTQHHPRRPAANHAALGFQTFR